MKGMNNICSINQKWVRVPSPDPPIVRFTIPWYAKFPLAFELYRDVYSGCAYQADIARIKDCIKSSTNNKK